LPPRSNLRDAIDTRIAAGDTAAALRLLSDLLRTEPTSATAAFAVSRYESLRNSENFSSYRLAILRSFTLEPVIPLLKAAAFSYGIALEVQLGDFNAYPQELLDPKSTLYSFAPDTVILAVEGRDLTSANSHSPASSLAESLQAWIATFRGNSAANLVVHNLRPAPGVPHESIDCMNQDLQQICQNHYGVYLLDYSSLAARFADWHDETKWVAARMPIRASRLPHLVNEWLRFVVPLAGRAAKVLVTDLDNTLWRGVVGEDGIDGIRIDPEFGSVQRVLLDLQQQGLLLAICSKNNSEDAMGVLLQHPRMILRPEHFASMRINWGDKAQNLREIAAELNLGLDSFAFLDDSPRERALIRAALPQVTVIELSSEPTGYAGTIRESPPLSRIASTSEDRRRTELYARENRRSTEEISFPTKEDFLRSLEQEVEVSRACAATIPRISQLTQKTNQFNLTTHRYTEAQIAEIAARPGWQVLSLRAQDRFGDHGIVGVAITHDDGDICEIDSLLLSCRVFARGIETALLSYIASCASTRGIKSLRGYFIVTRKNAPAQNFYAQHGFTQAGDANGSLWHLRLEDTQIACPEWIKLSGLSETEIES